MELLHAEITDKILTAFYGFRNKLPIELDLTFFKNALEIELLEIGLVVEKNKDHQINYKQKPIGKLTTDLIVNEKVVIKLVAEPLEISEKHKIEMKNFLRLTNYELGLILNFGADGNHKRILLTNNFKGR
jgi:GxxExxY protein